MLSGVEPVMYKLLENSKQVHLQTKRQFLMKCHFYLNATVSGNFAEPVQNIRGEQRPRIL